MTHFLYGIVYCIRDFRV